MLLDSQSRFNPPAANGTGGQTNIRALGAYISIDQIDLSQVAVPAGNQWDFGIAEYAPVFVVRQGTAFTGAGAILTIDLLSDTNANMVTTPVVHWSSGPIPVEQLGIANREIARTRLPLAAYHQFLGVRYTVTGAAFTAGNVDAFLTQSIQRNLTSRSGFTIPAQV